MKEAQGGGQKEGRWVRRVGRKEMGRKRKTHDLLTGVRDREGEW